MTKTGLFISFEGIDGAGKSTHIEGLAAAFKDQGRQVTLTREPGGTPLAETLRELVLHQPMDPLSEALLIFAARRDHLQQVIEPALARGDVVLCDRFTDATFAYQGGGRGFDLAVLSQLETWVQGTADGIRQPDQTIWFELDPRIAAERLAGARVPQPLSAGISRDAADCWCRRCISTRRRLLPRVAKSRSSGASSIRRWASCATCSTISALSTHTRRANVTPAT